MRELERVGVAGVQIEDQAGAKRCGHRPNKAVVETSEMVERVRAATGARSDDRLSSSHAPTPGLSKGSITAIERAVAYAEAGADVIFAEAPESADELRAFTAALDVPVLANITEFGMTPLLSLAELRDAGVGIALYPLSAARAAARATRNASTARFVPTGTQAGVLDTMQTRDELYDVLDYLRFERALDAVREEDA